MPFASCSVFFGPVLSFLSEQWPEEVMYHMILGCTWRCTRLALALFWVA